MDNSAVNHEADSTPDQKIERITNSFKRVEVASKFSAAVSDVGFSLWEYTDPTKPLSVENGQPRQAFPDITPAESRKRELGEKKQDPSNLPQQEIEYRRKTIRMDIENAVGVLDRLKQEGHATEAKYTRQEIEKISRQSGIPIDQLNIVILRAYQMPNPFTADTRSLGTYLQVQASAVLPQSEVQTLKSLYQNDNAVDNVWGLFQKIVGKDNFVDTQVSSDGSKYIFSKNGQPVTPANKEVLGKSAALTVMKPTELDVHDDSGETPEQTLPGFAPEGVYRLPRSGKYIDRSLTPPETFTIEGDYYMYPTGKAYDFKDKTWLEESAEGWKKWSEKDQAWLTWNGKSWEKSKADKKGFSLFKR